MRLAAKLLQWKIDIKSEEEKRQEVEQQMQAMSGGPATPVEQVTELGEQILDKLIAAGITTIEELADMTPEQLEEVPGIGEKTVEKISTAVRHHFGQYEEGEERPAEAESGSGASTEESEAAARETASSGAEGTSGEATEAAAMSGEETESMSKTPEEILAEEAEFGEAQELNGVSTEDIAAEEDRESMSDANDDADAREEQIEMRNDTVDTLVADSEEVSDEVVGSDEHDRG